MKLSAVQSRVRTILFHRELSQRWLKQGYIVVDVNPGLTSQYRSKRGRKKSDHVDAENVARAALANPG